MFFRQKRRKKAENGLFRQKCIAKSQVFFYAGYFLEFLKSIYLQ